MCKLEKKCVNQKKNCLTCRLNNTKLTTTIFLFEMKIIRLQLDYVDYITVFGNQNCHNGIWYVDLSTLFLGVALALTNIYIN